MADKKFVPETIEAGLASEFRSDLNTNFTRIENAVDQLSDEIATADSRTQNKIVISPDAPTDQRANDLWFQITE